MPAQPSEPLHPDIEPVDKFNRVLNDFSIELSNLVAAAKRQNYPDFVTDIIGQSTILGELEPINRAKYRHNHYDPKKGRCGLFGLWDELHQISRHMGGKMIRHLELYYKTIPDHSEKAALHRKLGQLLELTELMKDDLLPIFTQILDRVYESPIHHGEVTDKIELGSHPSAPAPMDDALIRSEGIARYNRHIATAKEIFLKAARKKYAKRHPGITPDDDTLELAFTLSILRIAGGQGIQSQEILQHKKIMLAQMGLGLKAARTLETTMNALAKMGVDIKESKLGLSELPEDVDPKDAPLKHPARHVYNYLHDIQLMDAIEKVMPPDIDIKNKAIEIPSHFQLQFEIPLMARQFAWLEHPTLRDTAIVTYVAADTLEKLLTLSQSRLPRTFWRPDSGYYDFIRAIRALPQRLSASATKIPVERTIERLQLIKKNAAQLAQAADAPEPVNAAEELHLEELQKLADIITADERLCCSSVARGLRNISDNYWKTAEGLSGDRWKNMIKSAHKPASRPFP